MLARRRALRLGTSAVLLSVLGACGTLAQPPRVARVGYLGNLPFDQPENAETLRQRLADLGWIEGHNLAFEWRYSDNAEPRLSELAAELARICDVVAVDSEPPARAMLRVSTTLPIVLVAHPDPIGAGLAQSLARPGGNLTGTGGNPGVANSKRTELLKELIPNLGRLGVLYNPTFPATIRQHLPEVQEAGRRLGLELYLAGARTAEEVRMALESIAQARVDGMHVISDPVIVGQQRSVVALAANARIPAVYNGRGWVILGGLMGLGTLPGLQFQVAANYINSILRGANPADLPMERANTLELSVNAGTAQALGLTFTPSFATQVGHWVD